VAKRDLVAEILDRRSRMPKGAVRFQEFERRQLKIMDILKFLTSARRVPRRVQAELLKYVPIGSVACLQGYTRRVIRDLIDSGDPYRLRAQRLEDLKVDLRTLIGFGTARITSGEVIAHLLPASSMQDVRRHLDTLLDQRFLTAWRAVELPTFTLGQHADEIFAALDEMFSKRHIYCHEIAITDAPSFTQATSYAHASYLFALGTERVILQEMAGGKSAPVGPAAA
jgi:hypothetical protein